MKNRDPFWKIYFFKMNWRAFGYALRETEKEWMLYCLLGLFRGANDNGKNIEYCQPYSMKKSQCAWSIALSLALEHGRKNNSAPVFHLFQTLKKSVIIWSENSFDLLRNLTSFHFSTRKHHMFLLYNQNRWCWMTLHFQPIFSGNSLEITEGVG